MTIAQHTHALPNAGDILRTELENGITVLVRENFTSPAVVVEGLIPGGALQDPVDLAGRANFHAAMLMRGTRHHTFSDLYEEIESNGASLSFSSGGHSYRWGSKSLAEDLPLMLNLAAEVIVEPAFPEEYVERVRGQLLTSLQMRAHNTRSMAQLRFQELAYPDHPYALSINGYPETVARITRDDLLAAQANLGPRGSILVIVGAIKAEDAVQMVREALGSWKNVDQPSAPSVPDAAPLAETVRSMVPIPGKTQSDIVLGYPGPRRSADDYQAARMANSILGVFGLMGRLGDNVREKQGLAYYSYSGLTGGLGPGPWRVSAGVAPENVDRAVESIRVEIRRMVEEPVTAEELSDNKAYFKGQLVLGLETNEGVAGSLMSMEMYDLGLDYLINYGEMIDALTTADVQAAAARYLNPDVYALAVAGPGEAT